MAYPGDGSLIFCRRFKKEVSRKECAVCWEKEKKRASTRLACRLNEISAAVHAKEEA